MITNKQVFKFVLDMHELTKNAVKQGLHERRHLGSSLLYPNHRIPRHVLRKAIVLFEQTFNSRPRPTAIKNALKYIHTKHGPNNWEITSSDNQMLLSILSDQDIMHVHVSSYNVGWY